MLFRNTISLPAEYPARRIPVRRTENRQSSAASFPRASTRQEQAEVEIQEAPAQSTGSNNHRSVAVETDWKAQAQRLQAEMENFRKRQERRAEEAIAAERERLLALTLSVADNLSRALNQSENSDGLRQGVVLTHRELSRLLEAEGVSKIEAAGQPFDPTLHEALATIPAADVEPNIIVEEIEAGYMLNNKLLRPARVVVAA